MKHYKAYLLDLDGTLYRGKEVIPEAASFVHKLKEREIPHLFVTNNSTASPEEVASRLQRMGVPSESGQILTSSIAAAAYLKTKPVDQTAYIIGEKGLHQALRDNGITEDHHSPGFVVIGLDRRISYEKLAAACVAVRKGAVFISTNADTALPTEKGLVPGNGAMTAVITTSTGVAPQFIGKPEKIMMEQALTRLGTKAEETAMIGDNYDTDILAGIRAGIDTIHVNTGVTSTDVVLAKPVHPTYLLSSMNEWVLSS
ncbi:TIGR01457 family HAD-type hydrolase [Alteribacillus sp. HJP-4]|uniref:TIGR01457 family HAD-type hydrolase n=1 Tax=Alteribacillus sp. HJP-4 TaxID=2775394 RepID=UPI0035CD2072